MAWRLGHLRFRTICSWMYHLLHFRQRRCEPRVKNCSFPPLTSVSISPFCNEEALEYLDFLVILRGREREWDWIPRWAQPSPAQRPVLFTPLHTGARWDAVLFLTWSGPRLIQKLSGLTLRQYSTDPLSSAMRRVVVLLQGLNPRDQAFLKGLSGNCLKYRYLTWNFTPPLTATTVMGYSTKPVYSGEPKRVYMG